MPAQKKIKTAEETHKMTALKYDVICHFEIQELQIKSIVIFRTYMYIDAHHVLDSPSVSKDMHRIEFHRSYFGMKIDLANERCTGRYLMRN